MLFGVCGNPEVAEIAARVSFDFMEWTVGELLKPREPYEAFRKALDKALSQGARYPVLNSFIPGDLRITGPDADVSALRAFSETALDRAEKAGVKIIVFGSGAARRVPDGFDKQIALQQIAAFCSMIAPIAHDHGVTIAVEPLNKAECNILNTVARCADLTRKIAHPGVSLLVDAYHLMRDGDSYMDIIDNADLLSHAHIATVPNRLAPGAEPCDFSEFFDALERGGYDGRISIEARMENPEKELPEALSLMRSLERKR
ncbi:sugar phosphate isomerase/epimerase [Candidatus Sumerlaeota bacterium]|nr:sugar phosphate isomerase/epimerase [Candidatus Sumerlaeota bacterium]